MPFPSPPSASLVTARVFACWFWMQLFWERRRVLTGVVPNGPHMSDVTVGKSCCERLLLEHMTGIVLNEFMDAALTASFADEEHFERLLGERGGGSGGA
mmetsp:Transcript_117366/g.203956  ORF Transcript_117366/g.203956 Transcript_117366/m.203956 type:complete len:99 (-) Transcript_117366:546-842(-)